MTRASFSSALRVFLGSVIALAMASCATRTSRSTLGAKWSAGEPVVDLGAYESVQKRPGQRSDIAVAVAISGGGMRAANFAAGVLTALEEIPVRGPGGRPSNLLREVDYFSTVSGGGLAVGSYISHLHEYQRQHPDDVGAHHFLFAAGGGEKKRDGRNWRVALANNYQSSIVGSFFNPAMLGGMDRGNILESRLDQHVLGQHDRRSLTLGDVFAKKGTVPRMPYWVANATVYENGAIFPFTPDILRAYGVTGYHHRQRGRRIEEAEDLPLAVGLKSSASFPVAIPPTRLKSAKDPMHPNLYLMDGGVADNLGIITALRLLRQDKASRKVLIIIDAYNGTPEPYSKRSIKPGMILSALRTTSISLDSAHQRIDNLLDTVARPSGMKYAVIDFTRAMRAEDEASTPLTDQIYDTLGIESMRQDETSPQSIQAIFTQALGVGTWFKISKDAQDTLLKAGKNAVRHHNGRSGVPGLLPEMRRIHALF